MSDVPVDCIHYRSSRMIIKSEEKASGLPPGGGQRGQFLSLQLALIMLLVAQA